MSFFSKWFGGGDEPIDLNTEANHHLITALIAHNEASVLDERGSVAAHHVREIAVRHATISSRIDDMLEAHERAGQGS